MKPHGEIQKEDHAYPKVDTGDQSANLRIQRKEEPQQQCDENINRKKQDRDLEKSKSGFFPVPGRWSVGHGKCGAKVNFTG